MRSRPAAPDSFQAAATRATPAAPPARRCAACPAESPDNRNACLESSRAPPAGLSVPALPSAAKATLPRAHTFPAPPCAETDRLPPRPPCSPRMRTATEARPSRASAAPSRAEFFPHIPESAACRFQKSARTGHTRTRPPPAAAARTEALPAPLPFQAPSAQNPRTHPSAEAH